jgi:hypothetical protein
MIVNGLNSCTVLEKSDVQDGRTFAAELGHIWQEYAANVRPFSNFHRIFLTVPNVTNGRTFAAYS